MLGSGDTALILLSEYEGFLLFVVVKSLDAKIRASFDALLGIIPSAARVGEAEGDLDATDDDSSQQAV